MRRRSIAPTRDARLNRERTPVQSPVAKGAVDNRCPTLTKGGSIAVVPLLTGQGFSGVQKRGRIVRMLRMTF